MSSRVTVFLAVAYSLSIALGLVVGLSGGDAGPLAGLRFLSMGIPAIAVLVVQSFFGERPRVDWHRLPLKYVPLALLLMPLVMHLAMLPVTTAYEGRLPWESWLTPGPDGLFRSTAPRGWGTLTLGALIGRIAINATVGVIVVSVLAFFEEIGWRGWLLPRLIDRMGVRRAVAATALIWALWHVPFELSGVQHVVGVSPLILAVTAPAGIFASGLVIGWFWIKTESIWIVSLAHGALNNWGQYAFKYMLFVHAPELTVGGAGTVALLILGTILLLTLPQHRPPSRTV